MFDRLPFKDFDDRRLMISLDAPEIVDSAVILENESNARHTRIALVVRCFDTILLFGNRLFHQLQGVFMHIMPLSIFGRRVEC